ncbi:MAG: histidine phosphatase family protein [Candidatus Yanofskybacteria bacterium]|nr:histidine phosphatase family protein [Candidatus Yanofskybacteria bacterium]
MGWPRQLVLVRHAESEGNIRTADERAQFDVATHAYPLTPRGRRQAVLSGTYLRDRFGNFDIFYVSYYQRSRETMSLMYPDARVYEDPRLAEGQRGVYHTLTQEQIEKIFPGENRRKEREGLYHFRALGGENWPDIELRIHSFLGTLGRDYDDQDVIIVVHGHWLILFQRLIHHFSIEEAVKRYKEGVFENASVTIYESVVHNNKSRLCLIEENIVPWAGKL